MLEVADKVVVSPNVLSDEHAEKIGRAALFAYASYCGPDFLRKKTSFLSRTTPKEWVWQVSRCYEFCQDMITELWSQYRPRMEERDGWTFKGEPLHAHRYVVMYIDGVEVLADSCWQQFYYWQRKFDNSDIQPPEDAPMVLIGTRTEVIAQAQSYGLTDERILNLWAEPAQQAA